MDLEDAEVANLPSRMQPDSSHDYAQYRRLIQAPRKPTCSCSAISAGQHDIGAHASSKGHAKNGLFRAARVGSPNAHRANRDDLDLEWGLPEERGLRKSKNFENRRCGTRPRPEGLCFCPLRNTGNIA